MLGVADGKSPMGCNRYLRRVELLDVLLSLTILGRMFRCLFKSHI